jgi:hypothetical protein
MDFLDLHKVFVENDFANELTRLIVFEVLFTTWAAVLYRIYKLEPKARVCHIRYNTDANVVNDLKNDSSYEFIGEVILKINVV